MIGDCRASIFAITSDQVHHSGRNAGFFTSVYQVVSRQRRIFGGLDDDGVAANERGDQFPRRYRHGKVPRRDQSAEANGLAHAHRKLVRHLGRSGKAMQTSTFAGGVIGAVDRFLHVAARFFEHLAHLAGHVRGEALLVADENLAEAEENLRPPRRRCIAPTVEGRLRRVHGRVHIIAGGKRETSNDVLSVRRVGVFKHLAGFTRNPLATDVVAVGFYLGARLRSGMPGAISCESFFCLSHG